MYKPFILIGSTLAALAVVFGAFGAHTLSNLLTEAQLKSFETAVKYQMYHALALILLGLLAVHIQGKLVLYSGVFFTLGTLFFSGSIYFLATRQLTGLSVKWLGPITPIGGVLLIIAWVLLFISVLKTNS